MPALQGRARDGEVDVDVDVGVRAWVPCVVLFSYIVPLARCHHSLRCHKNNLGVFIG